MDSRYFKLKNGLNIHADLVGQGPLMICLSGYANTNHNFKLLATYLKDHFTLCMIDARGMGKSDPAVNEYTMEDLGDDAVEIADQLGASSFGVIGISLGGYPAQLMAIKHPERIKNMVVIATRGPGPEYQIIRPVTAEGFTAFMNMPKEQGDRLAVALFVHPNFAKNHPDKLEEIIALRARENKITLEQSLMQLRAGYRFIDSKPEMKKIKTPTLILAGGEDSFLPKQNAELLQSEIKGSKLVYVPETSHLCFFEKPDFIASEIIRFAKF